MLSSRKERNEQSKKIYVDYIGFWNGFDKEHNFISEILKKRCEVVVSKDPEYVFVSSFCKPFEFAKYDCVRVFYTAEPFSPDFVSFDYCIGFDHIDAGDRYYRYPYYALRWNEKQIGSSYHQLSLEKAQEVLNSKERFCNFVYSHDTQSNLRQRVFTKLSEYKKVDSVGTYLNNQSDGYTVTYGASKDDYLRKSKFTIAIDSLCFPGFTTEKIIEPILCHSVPIYHGDPTISDYFNTKSFVHLKDDSQLDSFVEKVIELDQDDEKYIEMLMQNPFVEADHIEKLNQGFEDMLFHIVMQDHNKAFRRVREYLPKFYDNALKEHNRIKDELSGIKKHKSYWILKKLGKI